MSAEFVRVQAHNSAEGNTAFMKLPNFKVLKT